MKVDSLVAYQQLIDSDISIACSSMGLWTDGRALQAESRMHMLPRPDTAFGPIS